MSDGAAAEVDRLAIVETATDYIQGWLDGDVERLRRCLHPDLAKRTVDGSGRSGEPSIRTTTQPMMLEFTAAGGGTDQHQGFEIEVLDHYGDIATVVVRSAPYVDFLHVARLGDRWQIVNVLWQPRNIDATSR